MKQKLPHFQDILQLMDTYICKSIDLLSVYMSFSSMSTKHALTCQHNVIIFRLLLAYNYINHGAIVSVLSGMSRKQMELELMRHACKQRFRGARTGCFPYCGTNIKHDVARHVSSFHLDLAQILVGWSYNSIIYI